ncbi:hypothetical protein N7517_010751 [Penicillium concentricum]|uniref:F-box domain-containing protein n=1 Tax=Penicillium concentricum TaxID=293559 RepID=A0A9W9USW9_9EURO|nr:uncharacterized protein N7517_010751 [Penicillium concentricum]KAJ5356142.1 hypothetical protein N7517_010751 [Penicillium concentricum]
MKFLDLPLEIIYLITDFLELDSDISALSRTTRQLHDALDSCLYNNNVKRYEGCGLVSAARLGRLSVAEKLIDAGAPLATFNQAQAICLAAFYGHDAIVKLFLERGLRPNGQDEWWFPELEDCYKIVSNVVMDVQDYYDPIFVREEEHDPMDVAVSCGYDSMVQLLHVYGGMAQWDQAKVIKAMTQSICQSHPAVMRFLEEKYPGTIKYMIQNDQALLRTAGNTEVARILIEAGAPLDIAYSNGDTPLTTAVESGNVDLVRFLIEAGACPNPVGPNGVTLVHLKHAAVAQSLDLVQYLLTHVDVESKISAGGEDLAVLLLVAVACGFEEMLEKILISGCHLDRRSAPYQTQISPYKKQVFQPATVLAWAVKRGDIKAATLLLKNGADPNVERSGQTPLIAACKSGNTDLVVLLLKHGIDVNHTDRNGKPALVIAMRFSPIFEMILSRGPDCQVAFKSRKFNTIEWAIGSGNITLVQRLLDHGVPLEISQEAAKTRTLLTAASRGGVAMLQFLHPYGVIALPGDEGQIAMRSAVVRGDSLTTEYLLKQGFDPNPAADEFADIHAYGPWCGDYHDPKSYLIDAAEAADSEAAAATLDVLLRYGADINKLEKPPRCWSSYRTTANDFPERQFVSLRLLLERGANPLPEDKFGASMLKWGARAYHKRAIHLLQSYVDKRSLSLDDLHRNLLLVEKLSKELDSQSVQGSGYIVRVWRQLYWRKIYPVPK